MAYSLLKLLRSFQKHKTHLRVLVNCKYKSGSCLSVLQLQECHVGQLIRVGQLKFRLLRATGYRTFWYRTLFGDKDWNSGCRGLPKIGFFDSALYLGIKIRRCRSHDDSSETWFASFMAPRFPRHECLFMSCRVQI